MSTERRRLPHSVSLSLRAAHSLPLTHGIYTSSHAAKSQVLPTPKTPHPNWAARTCQKALNLTPSPLPHLLFLVSLSQLKSTLLNSGKSLAYFYPWMVQNELRCSFSYRGYFYSLSCGAPTCGFQCSEGVCPWNRNCSQPRFCLSLLWTSAECVCHLPGGFALGAARG